MQYKLYKKGKEGSNKRTILTLLTWSYKEVSKIKIYMENMHTHFSVSIVGLSLGTNSSMFANCSLFCDVQHVRSSVLGQIVIFGSFRSSVRLLCDQTCLGTYSLMFANCSGFCDVRHVRFWAKM